MGYPGKNHKQYQSPQRRFEKARIEDERNLAISFGLRNKKEIWKATHILRRHRQGARDILAMTSGGVEEGRVEARREELLSHLQRYAIIGAGATIDDVLSLKVNHILERRLQTIVYRKGLARSPKQARQLINHGHIAINDRRVSIPGYMVTRAEEDQISYYQSSPFTQETNPERGRINNVRE
ncbi:MAG: 30S ribosomal protein S4 [Methanocalculus sp. MSAO_Arc1]|uniref:30S ribosomal protein S4 n=1 Tax=Methanocalculus TaxID=71151 RepID=UPI000FF23621|nr:MULTISPECIES: 30S ribosomal protein S4 [unclassified Methanocalculus]MCP1662239.1 small subunit ribosomal protein S4 [Methanocalculus sp. AMF5]RQD81693.1 MAG: 30S ribosomal protein S4 [Methanocalculus sp. MSAO_Arc1]